MAIEAWLRLVPFIRAAQTNPGDVLGADGPGPGRLPHLD